VIHRFASGGASLVLGDTAPPGAKGFAVLSFGPDGSQGTPDDIKSWQ
jgi:hypothetical protein